MADQMHIATLQEQARDEADAAARAAPSPVADDPDMLRAAVELSRDIGEARPAVYWGDMLASTLLGYAALAAAMRRVRRRERCRSRPLPCGQLHP
jgi:hypothetical protein